MNKELQDLKARAGQLFPHLPLHEKETLNLLLDLAFELGGKDELEKGMKRIEEEFKKF
jgi:hypothetical protein